MPLHNTISTTPSTAIHQALDDLEVICNTPGYDIDMRVWYSFENDICSVCLGGCVMTAMLDARPDLRARLGHNIRSPGHLFHEGLFTDEQHTMIVAMDEIRSDKLDDIMEGLDVMNVPEEIINNVVASVYDTYDDDAEAFVSQRRMLANALKAHGY